LTDRECSKSRRAGIPGSLARILSFLGGKKRFQITFKMKKYVMFTFANHTKDYALQFTKNKNQ